jgi:hypothetical protein
MFRASDVVARQGLVRIGRALFPGISIQTGHRPWARSPYLLQRVGFDDIRLAQFVLPALTTIQMSQTELACLAFNALLAEVAREIPSPNGTEYVVKTNLVLRESTGIGPSGRSGRTISPATS